MKDIHAKPARLARSRPLLPGHLFQAGVESQRAGDALRVAGKGRAELLLHAFRDRLRADENILIEGIYFSQSIEQLNQILPAPARGMAEEHRIDADFHARVTSPEKFVAPLYRLT